MVPVISIQGIFTLPNACSGEPRRGLPGLKTSAALMRESVKVAGPKRFADSYYGLFKIVEEEMCRQYYLGFNVPIVIARF